MKEIRLHGAKAAGRVALVDDEDYDLVMAYRWRVWEDAGMEHHGFLCIGCLETRLGRRLNRADFTDADINSLDARWKRYAWWWRTPRLADRLSAPSPGEGIQLELW